MEPVLELCDICQHIKLEDYFCKANYPGTVELGRFQDIVKKDRCSLCKLVILAFKNDSQDHWKANIYPVEVCYLGRYKKESNRPVLEVWFHSTTETLPKGMWGHYTTLGQILPLQLPHTYSTSEPGIMYLSKLVGEKIDISCIRGWVKTCTTLHGPNCNSPKPSISKINGLKLRLVDVKQMKITECNWNSRYVALSYVWGTLAAPRLTQANIHLFRQDGALRELREELPQVTRDAIDMTSALGETYLWIDALCIVQDDTHSKDVYISQMSQIYSNAYVTLISLNGRSTESALPGVSHSRVSIQSAIEINGLSLVPRLPWLFIVEQQSAWSQRAWTFQEGIFSRRLLYFSEYQVFWQCYTTYQSEDISVSDGPNYYGSIQAPRAKAIEQEIGTDPRRQFNIYESYVKQFSARELTFHADSLFAFAGVVSAMTESFGWKFASALPEHAFDIALLWRPMYGRTARLRPRLSSDQKAEPLMCKSPTWCWTAWHGNLFWDAWHLDSFATERVSLKTEVACFWLQDSSGLRRIQRGYGIDYDYEIDTSTANDWIHADCALFFKAKTIGLEAYNLSTPQMDQCALWKREATGGGLSNYFRNNIARSLWIYDSTGHHCGTFPDFGVDTLHTKPNGKVRFEVVLLSRSSQAEVTQKDIQDFQDHFPLEYPSDREYYEETFDPHHCKYKKDWALNIMLVRRNNSVSERIAVGRMHCDAWKENIEEVRRIILA